MKKYRKRGKSQCYVMKKNRTQQFFSVESKTCSENEL